jgi:integrase
MNIKFSTYSKKSGLQQVIVRLYYGKFDLSVKLELFVSENDWNDDLQLTNSSNLINEKLLKLKSEILARYNEDYVQGILINKDWLNEIISNIFNRPSEEKGLINLDANIYLVEFANEWLKTKSSTWKVSHSKLMSKTLKGQYQNTVDLLSQYEKFNNCKIVMKDLSIDNFYEFANYLQEEENYNISTVERIIGRLRFFCNRAKENGTKISNQYTKRIYFEKEDEIESVYLNEDEITKIYNLQIDNEDLDHARDLLVISCYCGLRVSDLMHNLDVSKIKDGIISIKTKKTGSFVKIPVHNYIAQILNKRFGNLPKKINEFEYNTLIKKIGEIAKINTITFGSLWDPIKKRKVKGYHPKFKYFSSHLGRKSFTTNLSGKVSDEIIMSCAGWSNSSMKQHYNKTSKTDYALKLEKYWNEN